MLQYIFTSLKTYPLSMTLKQLLIKNAKLEFHSLDFVGSLNTKEEDTYSKCIIFFFKFNLIKINQETFKVLENDSVIFLVTISISDEISTRSCEVKRIFRDTFSLL